VPVIPSLSAGADPLAPLIDRRRLARADDERVPCRPLPPWTRAFSNPPPQRREQVARSGSAVVFGGVSSSADVARSADGPCAAVDGNGMSSSEIVGHYVLGVIFLTYLLLGCLRRRSVHKGPHPPCRPVALDPLKGRGALLARIVTQSLAG